jgi:CHASE3 domain sensor protein
MKWFRNKSIGLKLGGGFALILGLFLLLAIVFVKAIQVPKLVAQALLENQRMYIEVLNIDIALKEYQLSGSEGHIKSINAARDRYRTLSASLIRKVSLQHQGPDQDRRQGNRAPG